MSSDDLDRFDLAALRARRGVKWTRYGPRVLPAWVADMDFAVAPPIRERLAGLASNSDLGYAPLPQDTGMRELFAERMARRFGWELDAERVVVITDVLQGLAASIDLLCEPGDGVVVQTPIYPPFLEIVAGSGRRLVENRLLQDAERYEIDFAALERSIDDRTRLLLLCNPHNPSGRVLSVEELDALATLACERDLIVVADEIWGDLVFPPHRHVPLATRGAEIAARTITLTSATKSFNLAGLPCAFAHFGSARLIERFQRLTPHLLGGVGIAAIEATRAAWSEGDLWLEEVRAILDRNRRALSGLLARRIPTITYLPPEATYLAWLDCRRLDLEEGPGRFFLKSAQVALNDGRRFGVAGEGFARLNFATSAELLQEIVERMSSALRR
jgi:cystathionine beta-lyase